MLLLPLISPCKPLPPLLTYLQQTCPALLAAPVPLRQPQARTHHSQATSPTSPSWTSRGVRGFPPATARSATERCRPPWPHPGPLALGPGLVNTPISALRLPELKEGHVQDLNSVETLVWRSERAIATYLKPRSVRGTDCRRSSPNALELRATSGFAREGKARECGSSLREWDM